MCVYDKLTYAGNLSSLDPVARQPALPVYQGRHMRRGGGRGRLPTVPTRRRDASCRREPCRSLDRGSGRFHSDQCRRDLCAASRRAPVLAGFEADRRARDFRFHHISTDEVFGSLGPEGLFREDTPYAPNSPYSASKAGSDHLVRAWRHTYGLPTVATNCSNNYGPYHFPEKLIPLTILNALERKPLPVYGRGENIRDWLFVDDHVDALLCVIERGRVGESYNVGGANERRNIDVVTTDLRPRRRDVARGRPAGAPGTDRLCRGSPRP